MPKVIVAIPMSMKNVNDAIWFTGVAWLKSILAQDYEDFSVYILANNLQPEMLQDIKKIKDKRITLEYKDYDYPTDIRGMRKVNGGFKRFADIRNEVLNHVLSTDADYFISIDSDIIVHKDCISKLVNNLTMSLQYGMIAGVVSNSRRKGCDLVYPRGMYNFGYQIPKTNSTTQARTFKLNSFIDVFYSGALFISPIKFLREKEIKWGDHVNGEDLFFCQKIREAGYKIGVDTSILALHLMDQFIYKNDVIKFQRNEVI